MKFGVWHGKWTELNTSIGLHWSRKIPRTSTRVFRAFNDYLAPYPYKHRVISHSGTFPEQMAIQITV